MRILAWVLGMILLALTAFDITIAVLLWRNS